MPYRPARATGRTLVLLQFALMAVIALAAWRSWQAAGASGATVVPLDAQVLVALAVALAVWALSANRPGNFNLTPDPRPGSELIRHGPYRWIRHPMYAAVLLAAVAGARVADRTDVWLAFVALVAVLLVKAAVEERALLRRHPDYQAYRRATRRFVPFVF